MFRIFVVALSLSCLATATLAKAEPAPRAGRPTGRAEIGRCEIGVVPVGGNLFMIEKFGSFAFNDLHVRAAADGWGFDDLIVSRVRAAAPAAAVRKIAYSREQLAQARNAPAIFRIADSNLKDFVRQVSAGANCDRYVMVHRHGGKRVFGIGIAKFEASLVNRTYLYALMYVRVYDGRTFELIKDGPARIDDEPFLSRAFVNPIGGPYRVVDDRSFPASREEAVANPTLREGVRALLTASLDKTLPVMLRQSARQPPQ